MKTAVIIIGIQGSGKSEFYRRYLSDKYIRINLDTLKTRYKEKQMLMDCIDEGKDFAIDNTNPTKEDRQRYIVPAKASGYRIIGYFMESKLQVCIKRNDLREGKERIPAQAIAATSNKLQMPSYGEGFDELFFVANDGTNMTISPWRDGGRKNEI